MRTDEAIIAHFFYIPVQTPGEQQQHPGNEGSDDDYGSVGSAPQQALVTYGSYILDSRVNGRLSMIVDIGAFINILGAILARQIAQSGLRHGHQSTQVRLDRT